MESKNIIDGFAGWRITDRGTQIELRKHFSSDVLIITNDGNGYNHGVHKKEPDRWGRSTKDVDIHFSCNGPLQMSYDEWDEIDTVVTRCKEYYKAKKRV